MPDFSKLPNSKHTMYIMSIRDVYDRTVSSFLYQHPENVKAYNDHAGIATSSSPSKLEERIRLAYSCFPTLESFVRNLPIISSNRNNDGRNKNGTVLIPKIDGRNAYNVRVVRTNDEKNYKNNNNNMHDVDYYNCNYRHLASFVTAKDCRGA